MTSVGLAFWGLNTSKVNSRIDSSTTNLLSTKGTLSGLVVFSNRRRKILSSCSALSVCSKPPSVLLESSCKKAWSAFFDNAIVWILTPVFSISGNIFFRIRVRSCVFLASSLAISIIPSVKRIILLCFNLEGVLSQSATAASSARPILVKRSRE